ncbi:MAG: MerR family transcriptional regulator [Acidobacteria bacterium]|nr:MerR family transcriptional regulator [Acidobacteriota bacterium]
MTAEMVGVSVPTLRMYENEGLLIPIKSDGGTRYFDENDIAWIRCIRRMITELGLNLEGIRRLLALIPCRDFKKCDDARYAACQADKDVNKPCWIARAHNVGAQLLGCHDCPAFRYSINCESLKSLFVIRLRQLTAARKQN